MSVYIYIILCEFVMYALQNSITDLLMRPSAVAVDVNLKFTQKVHLATITRRSSSLRVYDAIIYHHGLWGERTTISLKNV